MIIITSVKQKGEKKKKKGLEYISKLLYDSLCVVLCCAVQGSAGPFYYLRNLQLNFTP